MVKHLFRRVGVTKTKHPNKGHTLNKGQRPMYQSVCYSESPLYIHKVMTSQLDPACKKQI